MDRRIVIAAAASLACVAAGSFATDMGEPAPGDGKKSRQGRRREFIPVDRDERPKPKSASLQRMLRKGKGR